MGGGGCGCVGVCCLGVGVLIGVFVEGSVGDLRYYLITYGLFGMEWLVWLLSVSA